MHGLPAVYGNTGHALSPSNSKLNRLTQHPAPSDDVLLKDDFAKTSLMRFLSEGAKEKERELGWFPERRRCIAVPKYGSPSENGFWTLEGVAQMDCKIKTNSCSPIIQMFWEECTQGRESSGKTFHVLLSFDMIGWMLDFSVVYGSLHLPKGVPLCYTQEPPLEKNNIKMLYVLCEVCQVCPKLASTL